MGGLEDEFGERQGRVDIVAVQGDVDDAAAMGFGREPVDGHGLAGIVGDVGVFQCQLLQERAPGRQQHAGAPFQPAQDTFQPDAVGGLDVLGAIAELVLDGANERQERCLDRADGAGGGFGGVGDGVEAGMGLAFAALVGVG